MNKTTRQPAGVKRTPGQRSPRQPPEAGPCLQGAWRWPVPDGGERGGGRSPSPGICGRRSRAQNSACGHLRRQEELRLASLETEKQPGLPRPRGSRGWEVQDQFQLRGPG